jgi:hypothetical protein
MATPHVTGAVALCKASNSSLTAGVIKQLVLDSTTVTPSLTGKTLKGRLDVGELISQCTIGMPTQDPLTITNTETSVAGNVRITLAASGGSSTITSLSFSTTGAGCAISGNILSVTIAPTTCSVTAQKAGNGLLKSVTSPAKNVTFTQILQSTLTISNTTLNIAKGTTGVTLTTRGGSGTGAVTFATTNPTACKLISNKLTVATTVIGTQTCTVTATKAASGIYSSTSSFPVTFTFN